MQSREELARLVPAAGKAEVAAHQQDGSPALVVRRRSEIRETDVTHAAPLAHIDGSRRDVDTDDVQAALLQGQRVSSGAAAEVEHGAVDVTQDLALPRQPLVRAFEELGGRHRRHDASVVDLEQEDAISRRPVEMCDERRTEGVLLGGENRRSSRVPFPLQQPLLASTDLGSAVPEGYPTERGKRGGAGVGWAVQGHVGRAEVASFCRRCGRRSVDGNSFCTGCGAALDEPNAAPQAVQQAHTVVAATAGTQRRSNVRVPTVIVLLVAVVAVAWPVIEALRAQPSLPVVAIEPVASLAPTSTEPVTCVSNQDGFEITVPASWARATADHATCRQFIVPLDDSNGAVVTVMPDEGDFDEMNPQGEVSEINAGNIGDVPATFYKSTVESDGEDLRVYAYILDNDGEAFVIALVSEQDVEIPKSVKRTFDQVVRQVEL